MPRNTYWDSWGGHWRPTQESDNLKGANGKRKKLEGGEKGGIIKQVTNELGGPRRKNQPCLNIGVGSHWSNNQEALNGTRETHTTRVGRESNS